MEQKKANLICMIVPYFDRIGGYELQALSLCKAYQRFGIKTFILTTYSSGHSHYEKKENIDIYRVPRFTEGIHAVPLYVLYLFWKLKKVPSIFHCHSISPFTEQILTINRYLKIPVLCKIATQGDIHRLQAELHRIGKRGLRRKKNYEQVTFISINSNIKQELVNFNITKNNIISIPNGVDTTRFVPISQEEKIKIKQEVGFLENEKLITFVGRFEERKRTIDLIQAWGVIEKKYPQHHLLLVGDGDERKTCENLCTRLNLQKRVTFIGLSPCVDKFLQISDLFVFPSRLEGLPNVILEAMATGLPILSTDISGINEVIEHEKTGFLVPPQNQAALIQGLHYLLLNPLQAQEYGLAARQKILSEYCFNQVAPKFFDLYESLAKVRTCQ